MTAWETLGVATDVEVADLRRRYAALIKQYRPETHPQEFARIREAYEVVLPHARRREALAAERAEAAPVEEVAQVVEEPAADVVADVAPVHEHIVAPIEVIAPLSEPEATPEPEPEPALALHFRAFHAQAANATGSDDEAHLPALRALLQARTQATLDDSQALEFALMRWFIESESPPLTLLFETGRVFDWHRHAERLSNWLSPWALRQMEARLALSRDLVHARHFSGNAWLRRLHAVRPGGPLLAWRPAAVEAGLWVERWQRGCEDADVHALAACLNPVAIQRLRGPASTDLLLGFAAAAVAWHFPAAIAWGLFASAIVFGARRALQAIGALPESHVARRVLRWMSGNTTVVGVIAAVTGAIGIGLFNGIQSGPGERAVGGVLMVPVVVIGVTALWRVAAFVESLLAWLWQWREAVDRMELDRFLHGTGMPDPRKPFGARLGVFERLRAIPASLRLQAIEIATRERPPRLTPIRLSRIKGVRFIGFKRENRWRLVWFGAWVAYAIARLLHATGGAH